MNRRLLYQWRAEIARHLPSLNGWRVEWVTGDRVIIEDDRTDKPLVKRLVAAGIPREKIIWVYANAPRLIWYNCISR
ncbi:MAG: XisI protein [Anaerolineae bacterium]|nr:MAG: XisI protein [Anaerolineae bacterium]